MQNIEHIIAFITLSIAVASVPGPTSLYIFSQGLSRSWKRPFFAIVGVLVANILWVLLCSIGAAAVIRDSNLAFEILRSFGCAYLAYLGISLFKSKTNHKIGQESSTSLFFALSKGFLTSISNPKAALFYLSFLPQFVGRDSAYHIGIIKFGLGYILIMLVIFSIYGFLAFQINHFVRNGGKSILFKKMVGCSFIASAISLWKFKQA
ncbi:LysE family translocator [uncultured Desulfuromusa sp.]|uniref:LysE family translocator n=1 Tax=uncultured Desulfuromusa sp. TaxID=219183 RepID=UPI002AA6E3DA|nr:LysE family translocator [uncultured Desulfuromusa sp.]